MTEVTVSTLSARLKDIEADFNKAVVLAQKARDEQIRLLGERDAIEKLIAELGPPEKKDKEV